jgi:23S rRNA-/tRNA-specific pseudouridylate synthase
MKVIDILSEKYNISKRLSKKYLKSGYVSVHNNKTYENKDVTENDIAGLELNINYIVNTSNIESKKYIIKKYEDIIFLYKPSFVHTERHRLEDLFTIEDIISAYYPRFKLISRLDYQTDGLISAINSTFKVNNEEKHYIALVHGRVEKKLDINNVIVYKKRKKVMVLEHPDKNTTHVMPIKKYSESTIAKIIIKKGLRHQIRAHLAYNGYPIYGDMQYGLNDNAKRLMLSCYYVKINNFICFSPHLKEFYTQIKELINK